MHSKRLGSSAIKGLEFPLAHGGAPEWPHALVSSVQLLSAQQAARHLCLNCVSVLGEGLCSPPVSLLLLLRDTAELLMLLRQRKGTDCLYDAPELT